MQHNSERKFKNVYLTGLPGSGKSTLGKTFAYLSRRNFLDFDRFFEELTQRSIADVFSSEGEEGFRALEKKVLKRIARMHNQVVATGGGTLCSPENLHLARTHGLVVHVEAPFEILASRIHSQQEKRVRPLFSDCENIAQITERLKDLWEKRAEFYSSSDLAVSSGFSSIDSAALELLYLEEKMFHRDFQRVVAAVGEVAPPHIFPQGHYWLIKRYDVPEMEQSDEKEDDLSFPPPPKKETQDGKQKSQGRHQQKNSQPGKPNAPKSHQQQKHSHQKQHKAPQQNQPGPEKPKKSYPHRKEEPPAQ